MACSDVLYLACCGYLDIGYWISNYLPAPLLCLVLPSMEQQQLLVKLKAFAPRALATNTF